MHCMVMEMRRIFVVVVAVATAGIEEIGVPARPTSVVGSGREVVTTAGAPRLARMWMPPMAQERQQECL